MPPPPPQASPPNPADLSPFQDVARSIHLPPYPSPLPRRLTLTLFPLDITTPHLLTKSTYDSLTTPLLQQGSPLAEWTTAFLAHAFRISAQLGKDGLSLHDPLCIWYVLTDPDDWIVERDEDIRVETAGQWTRGFCVVDRRRRQKREGEVGGDEGGWLSLSKGNRVRRTLRSPGYEGQGERDFGGKLLKSVFALSGD